MFSDNRTLRGMMFGAILTSIVSVFIFTRRRQALIVDMPRIGLKKGGRILQSGTRSAMRGAKRGLRALSR